MPYPSSQRNLSASQADFPSSHFGVAIAPDLTIALLTARINTLCTQIVEMQTRLKELEEMAYPIDRRYRAPDPENTVYSPIVKLSFKAMKLLFLFLAGFLLVYVLAGSLGVFQVMDVLQILLSVWLMPLAGLVFCIIAIAAIIESLK